MIIDCFPFFNELDILEIRLNELYDHVDHFVLVEASKTQSLIDKPYFFEKNKSRYDTFLDKIIHVKVDDCPNNSYIWEMENFQRNCIDRGIRRIENLNSNDIIMISDLDEIPSKKSIELIKCSNEPIGSINMFFYAYYFNMLSVRSWIGTVFCSFEEYKNKNPQYFRSIKDSLNLLNNGENLGWHLSWMGGCKKIWQKSHCCIEPFDKSKIVPFEEFEKMFNELIKRKKFIHIENLNKNGEEFIILDDNKNLPKYVLNNLDIYKQFFTYEY